MIGNTDHQSHHAPACLLQPMMQPANQSAQSIQIPPALSTVSLRTVNSTFLNNRTVNIIHWCYSHDGHALQCIYAILTMAPPTVGRVSRWQPWLTHSSPSCQQNISIYAPITCTTRE